MAEIGADAREKPENDAESPINEEVNVPKVLGSVRVSRIRVKLLEEDEATDSLVPLGVKNAAHHQKREAAKQNANQ